MKRGASDTGRATPLGRAAGGAVVVVVVGVVVVGVVVVDVVVVDVEVVVVGSSRATPISTAPMSQP